MKKICFMIAVVVSTIILISCEGKENYDYDNQGLSEKEMAHTKKIIDSSLSKMRKEFFLADSLTKKEIAVLKEEIKKLRK